MHASSRIPMFTFVFLNRAFWSALCYPLILVVKWFSLFFFFTLVSTWDWSFRFALISLVTALWNPFEVRTALYWIFFSTLRHVAMVCVCVNLVIYFFSVQLTGIWQHAIPCHLRWQLYNIRSMQLILGTAKHVLWFMENMMEMLQPK